jgi:CDP-4-dehydro-6-deoxyglucose reductase
MRAAPPANAGQPRYCVPRTRDANRPHAKVPDRGSGVRISLSKSGRSFSVAPAQSVLDAALGAGLNLPHSCKGGNCGSCRAKLLRGEIIYPNGRPLGLSDTEVAEGLVLLCQARARTDLCIETYEMSVADEALIKRLPCRIEHAQALSYDVMALYLRLPAAEQFRFEPGQYVDVMLSGGRRRSFSIASPPHDSRLLELHVRRVAGGEFTDRLFSDASRNSLLTIEGPLGQFVYRSASAPPAGPATRPAAGPATRSAASAAGPPGRPTGPVAGGSAAPMLLIGGGTGLAPLNSIIRHVVENSLNRDMTLYWGVRAERDLYAHAALEDLARRAPKLRYTPVLSEPSAAWTGQRGWVHEAVLRDIRNLVDYEVYASGPPAMIAAVRAELGARGVPAARIFFDSFDYAPDALERQRISAASKS